MNEIRALWLNTLLRIADPVLNALAADRLKETMPVRGKQAPEVYAACTYLEAFGRTLVGLAPWLACTGLSGPEEARRQQTAALVRRCLAVATDPARRDYMNFAEGMQPIVDAAFLAQGILRAPQELWDPLDDRVKQNVLAAMRATRTRKPGFNNWLLFAAMVECLLHYAGAPDWDPMRVDYALKQHLQWYKGDGVYGDGPQFHWDYYNSYVIQPMLVEIATYMQSETRHPWAQDWQKLPDVLWPRLAQYAAIQEHLIAPDGSYPLLGRSLCYRMGAFQCLALAAWRHKLNHMVTPAGVRCGLTAVLKRLLAFENMFDAAGFLQVGVCGAQPSMGEDYISTGSLYLFTAGFLPLGLPDADPFWQDPDADWTMKALWSGQDRPCEHWIS